LENQVAESDTLHARESERLVRELESMVASLPPGIQEEEQVPADLRPKLESLPLTLQYLIHLAIALPEREAV
jgi:hypothetical protein